MTWSRFDDAARNHPKAAMAGNEAWGFWCASIMYSNQYGTDGFVPDSALAGQVLPCPIPKAKAKALAERLCEARLQPGSPGLFIRDDARGGYIINDFLEWNPSKAEVDAKRKADRERKRNPPGRPPDSGGTPPRIPPGTTSGSGLDSASRAGARGRSPISPPDLPDQPDRPEQRGRAGLRDRLLQRKPDENGVPRPRHDPAGERIAFVGWFPSQEILDYAKASGLSDREFDEAVNDAGKKLNGPGHFDWWDEKILKFVVTAVERRRRENGSEVDRARREAAAQAAHEKRLAEANARARERHGEPPAPLSPEEMTRGIG